MITDLEQCGTVVTIIYRNFVPNTTIKIKNRNIKHSILLTMAWLLYSMLTIKVMYTATVYLSLGDYYFILTTDIYLTHCLISPSGRTSEMLGGNLGRSKLLADFSCLRDSADHLSAGGPLRGSLPFCSEAEGLELLSQDSPGDTASEFQINTRDSATGLLDYESDGQESVPTVLQPMLSAEDPLLQAAMDTEPAGPSQPVVAPVMDSVYYQCHSARTSCQKDTLVSISVDESFGKRMTIQSPSIGSLEDHDGIGNTFHGSRVMKGNHTVNESISSSFDLSKLVCVSCSVEDAIIGKKPSVFLFTDQNFVPSVACQTKEVVNVFRVENASLLELFEIAKETLGNVTLPEGSIFMFGSVSHLSRMGTSSYAKDWTDVNALTVETWHGSRVCPLIPLIRSECVGSVVRELNELSLWFEEVYDSDPQGLHEVWRGLVAAMDCFSTGTTSLGVMDSYKVLLPGSLQCRTLNKPVTFCSSSSRPVTFSGLPKDRCDKLLGILLANVFRNFRACSRPEGYLVRAAGNTTVSETPEQKVILVGASNMTPASQFFADCELSTENHSIPGWMPTAENVQKMSELVEDKAKGGAAFVFDILSNSAVRYEQFDGTTALPFKSSGRYHLGGGVVPTPIATFKKVIEHVLPIFKAKGNSACIKIPPLPRYIFSRCCTDASHCTNADKNDFPTKMLTGFTQQRNELIKSLLQHGLTNFKVLDVGCITTSATTASLPEKLEELRKVSAGDGIHFSANGYRNLAQRTLSCLKTLRSEKPKPTRKSTFFWRGFRSPRGSLTVNVARSVQARPVGGSYTCGGSFGGMRGVTTGRRSRSQKYHPYRRW